MNQNLLNRQIRHLQQREALSITETHFLWRLESGALRIDSTGTDETETLVRLALPGDVLGMESMLGVPDRFTFRALTVSRLVPVDPQAGQLPALLEACVITSYQRNRDMVKLRTGSAEERIKGLLRLLASGDGNAGDETAACAVPTLNDIAAIVHAAPETVCRTLASLRQVSFLQENSPQGDKFKRLAQRAHRLQARGVGSLTVGASA